MKTLHEKFTEVCLDFADKEAMRVRTPNGWVVYQYKDLLHGARRVAAWLASQEFKKQDRAALVLDNSPQWGMIYFGILLAGGVAVPLDPQASRQDIVTFLEDSKADVVFLENRLLESFQHHLRFVKKIVVLKKEKQAEHCFSLEGIMAQQRLGVAAPMDICDDDTASIIYSSGTTSDPKGVELSHRNLYANFSSIDKLKVSTKEDNFISILPLFHAYAFMATLLYPLFIGAKITYPKTMKSSELLSVIKENAVTMVVGVPELFNNIHKGIFEQIRALPFSQKFLLSVMTEAGWQIRKWTGLNLLRIIYYSLHERFGKKLRYLISGGARLDPKVAFDFQRFGFAIIEGYGLTETSPLVTLNPLTKAKCGSVGKPVDGVEIRIVNPDPKGVGEIAIKGANVMKGYYQKPEETQKVIRDGWFYSGDLGFLDAEGYLYISGRLKEVIVLGSGKNIFPEEIEKYYAQSQYIKEAGVFLSDEEHGQSLRAVIVPNFDVFKKSGLINVIEKIRWDIENISRDLSAYKRIMGFVISKEDLPKTRLGKIKRYQLSQIYLKESHRSGPSGILQSRDDKDVVFQSPMGGRIAQFLQNELSLSNDVKASDHLELDLGVDSLARVELVSGLERLFHIRLPDDIFKEVGTVAELVAKVEEVFRADVSQEYHEDSAKSSWPRVLHADVHSEQFPTIDLNPPLSHKLVGFCAKGLFFTLLKIFGRFKIIDRNNLPSKGPYIICCNHSSYLDALIMVAGISNNIFSQAYFIGLKDIFDHVLLRWSVRLAKIIPIDPSTELVGAMQAASFVLRKEKVLCIFPEGQRSIDGEIKKFKKGIGILAKELDVPIVPAAIAGSFQMWPRTVAFPKPHPVKIIFGKPLNASEILSGESAKGEGAYEKIANHIQNEVSDLFEVIKLPEK